MVAQAGWGYHSILGASSAFQINNLAVVLDRSE